ncbi:LysR family transcriptional regulator [Cupriavidus sp. 2TAF22]|uniref:LysR family transcriptional regulator n=1 Tax=unclassified Cupriavidus TaxID=2640874 RepID=UPI003F916CA9
MDNLAALNVFVRAAEARSFTEVGRQLGVSPSAVGKTVARLEERLHVRLFHRSTRSISLTPEGGIFLESCKRIFAELENAQLELAQSRGAPSGRLRVSMPLVGSVLTPVVGRFMAAYPEIEMDLDFSDRLVNVIEEGFDVVVRTGDVGDTRLSAHTLSQYQLKLFGSPAYFKRAGVPRRPHDLKSHACLHHKFPTSGKLERWPFAADATDPDFELPVSATASSVEPLVELAEQGLGIVCVPDYSVRRQRAEGTLVSVLDDYLDHTGWLRAVWPSSRYLSPKVRVFVDYLVEHLLPEQKPTRPPGARARQA